jgi:hypothetical protein
MTVPLNFEPYLFAGNAPCYDHRNGFSPRLNLRYTHWPLLYPPAIGKASVRPAIHIREDPVFANVVPLQSIALKIRPNDPAAEPRNQDQA